MNPKKDMIDNIQKKGMIFSSNLKRLRKMTDCSDWNACTPLGLVDFVSEFHHWDGGILEFQGYAYYITKKQIAALSQFVNWKFKKVIKVVKDETSK
jgi:hypothetical protein